MKVNSMARTQWEARKKNVAVSAAKDQNRTIIKRLKLPTEGAMRSYNVKNHAQKRRQNHNGWKRRQLVGSLSTKKTSAIKRKRNKRVIRFRPRLLKLHKRRPIMKIIERLCLCERLNKFDALMRFRQKSSVKPRMTTKFSINGSKDW